MHFSIKSLQPSFVKLKNQNVTSFLWVSKFKLYYCTNKYKYMHIPVAFCKVLLHIQKNKLTTWGKPTKNSKTKETLEKSINSCRNTLMIPD